MSFEDVLTKIAREKVAADLFVERADRLSISFQQRKMNKFESSQSQCAGLRVIEDGVAGYAYSENLGDAALLEAYRSARANARFIASGGAPKIPARLFGQLGEVAELADLHNDSLAQIDMEAKVERARLLESVALDHDPRVQSTPSSGYAETASEVEIFSTNGLKRRQRFTHVSGYTYAIASEGGESVQSHELLVSRNAAGFDPRPVAERSATQAVAKLGARPPSTGRYPVVFTGDAMTSILGAVADYFAANAVEEKRSIFATSLGQKIASPLLSITDDPFYKDGLGSRAFDGEGLAAIVTPLVKNGVLTNFLTNTVYAEHMRLPLTASAARGARSPLDIGVSNFVVTPGPNRREDLLAAGARVILVSEVAGFHAGFREGTGDFSLQAEGELWEKGRRARAVKNFVVSGSVRQLLNDIEGLGHHVSTLKSNIVAPDFLIRELSIAGA